MTCVADSGLQSDKSERIKKLVPYIRELIGERSIRQASKDIGITSSYLSGVLKERYLPTAEMLRKMADEKSKPQKGVTLEDLMVAAGYQQDYVLNVAIKVLDKDSCADAGYVKVMARYEKIAKTICLSEITQNNIAVKPVECATGILKGYKPNLVLSVSGQPVSEWWLDFCFYDESCKADEITLCDFLGLLTNLPSQKDRKVSRVINDKRVFEQLSVYAGNLSYRGDLSIILVDTNEMCVLEEVYLSHYCEENKNSEFYII